MENPDYDVQLVIEKAHGFDLKYYILDVTNIIVDDDNTILLEGSEVKD